MLQREQGCRGSGQEGDCDPRVSSGHLMCLVLVSGSVPQQGREEWKAPCALRGSTPITPPALLQPQELQGPGITLVGAAVGPEV